MFLRLAVVVLLLAQVVGCGTTIDGYADGGPGDGSVEPPATLTLLTPDLALVFGQEATFQVRYARLDGGTPIVGAPVQFAIDGRGGDSTLMALAAQTEIGGIASGTVEAGMRSTAFRVRISAAGAEPVYLNVSVGDEGFGTLDVGAVHEGTRPVEQLVVSVFSERTCADVDTAVAPDRVQTVPLDDEAHFVALPVGVGYAVTVLGESPTGTTVAYGCRDMLSVRMETPTAVVVAIDDKPLEVEGTYEADLTLDTATAGARLGAVVSIHGLGVLGERGGDAPALLDEIVSWLRASGNEAAAAALESERDMTDVDAELGRRLADASAGPTLSVSELAAMLEANAARMQVRGRMTVMLGRITPEGFWATDLAIGPVGETEPGLVLDLTTVRAAAGPVNVTALPDEDTLLLGTLGVELPLGRVGVAAIEALAARAGLEGGGARELLHARSGCGVLDEWAADRPTLRAACGEGCTGAACESLLSAVADAIEDGLEQLDTERSGIVLSGRADLSDDDADLETDRMSAPELSGHWTGEGSTEGDPLTGDAAAVRIPD
jgi:hypothetical protein